MVALFKIGTKLKYNKVILNEVSPIVVVKEMTINEVRIYRPDGSEREFVEYIQYGTDFEPELRCFHEDAIGGVVDFVEEEGV